jgi:hypothetical protein
MLLEFQVFASLGEVFVHMANYTSGCSGLNAALARREDRKI